MATSASNGNGTRYDNGNYVHTRELLATYGVTLQFIQADLKRGDRRMDRQDDRIAALEKEVDRRLPHWAVMVIGALAAYASIMTTHLLSVHLGG